MIVKIAKNWNSSDIMRQTPGGTGAWDGVQFTTGPVGHCDYVIVLNHLDEPLSIECPPENVWALMQEPYIAGIFDWMVEDIEQYSRVFTHHNIPDNNTIVPSHPAVPWFLEHSYDELKTFQIPEKRELLSWVTSNKSGFPGHKKRMAFLNYIVANGSLPIDIYGVDTFVDIKHMSGLGPYYYALAIENASGPHYWTEKLADCFLTWSVPFYYGCTNLADYFPQDSYIWIDIEAPHEATSLINQTMSHDDWQRRLPAVEEARRLILEEYQFFPHIVSSIREYGNNNSPAQRLSLTCPARPQKRSVLRRFTHRIKNVFRL